MTSTNKFTLITISLLTLGFLVLSLPSKDPVITVAEKGVVKTVCIKVRGDLMVEFLGIELGTIPVVVGGAGVYITPRGHVLTCAHLFELNTINSIIIYNYDGSVSTATLLHKDESRDLALLSVDIKTSVAYAKLGDPRKLQVGQEVVAIGAPLGFDWTVTHGIISALNRDNMGVYNMIQSDAFLNPGNSGGPLFNLNGDLVGINSRISPPVNAPVFTGLGFAVDPGQIYMFLAKFKGLEKVF